MMEEPILVAKIEREKTPPPIQVEEPDAKNPWLCTLDRQPSLPHSSPAEFAGESARRIISTYNVFKQHSNILYMKAIILDGLRSRRERDGTGNDPCQDRVRCTRSDMHWELSLGVALGGTRI